jgi:UDP-3-O-[3-hydroxymyristoyl] N-acetylglucosamine deacetylase
MSSESSVTSTTPPAPGPGAFFVVEGVGFATGRANRVRVHALDHPRRSLKLDGGDPVDLSRSTFHSSGRCSRLGDTGPLEHIAAGLAIAGVQGWVLEAEHSDLPLLDGSAKVWYEAAKGIAKPGAAILSRPVSREVETLRNDRGGSIVGTVADRFRLRVVWSRGPEGPETWTGGIEDLAGIVGARTFIDLHLYLSIRARGDLKGTDVHSGRLLKGETPLDDACLDFARELGVDPRSRVWTGGPERMAGECAAHKALDLVGDILLWLGYLPCLDVVACDAGHALHHEFGARLRQDSI